MGSVIVFLVNFSGFTGFLEIVLMTNRNLKDLYIESKPGKTGFIAELWCSL